MTLGCTIAEAQVSELQLLRVYWGYIAIMEKRMETTIMGFRVRVWRLGLARTQRCGKGSGGVYFEHPLNPKP